MVIWVEQGGLPFKILSLIQISHYNSRDFLDLKLEWVLGHGQHGGSVKEKTHGPMLPINSLTQRNEI